MSSYSVSGRKIRNIQWTGLMTIALLKLSDLVHWENSPTLIWGYLLFFCTLPPDSQIKSSLSANRDEHMTQVKQVIVFHYSTTVIGSRDGHVTDQSGFFKLVLGEKHPVFSEHGIRRIWAHPQSCSLPLANSAGRRMLKNWEKGGRGRVLVKVDWHLRLAILFPSHPGWSWAFLPSDSCLSFPCSAL